MLMPAGRLSQVLIVTTLLSACGKGESPRAATTTAPVSQGNATTSDPAVLTSKVAADESIAYSQPLSIDANADQQMIQLASWGPITSTEESALGTAKEKIQLVKAARVVADQNKKIALDAKAVYTAKLQVYQQFLAEADTSRKARAKAMVALSAAQKELDDAWSAVSAARDAYNKAITDPKATAEQKAAAEGALAKANSRAEQAAALTETRTAELQTSQRSSQALLTSSVTSSAQAASTAGTEYAAKVAVAARAVEAVNFAVTEEKKAMSVIFAINKNRAKVVAETLADAAFSLTQARAAAENARDNAKTAEASRAAAANRMSVASRDAANAKQAAANATENAARARLVALEKSQAKTEADAVAATTLKAYSDAKSIQDSAQSASGKAAAEAKLAAKALADATAKAAAATKAVETATPEKLAEAQAALTSVTDAQRAAQAQSELASARATELSASAAQAKAEADSKLAAYRQASASATTAAKEKATADAVAANTAKAAANASSASTSADASSERAAAASGAANRASQLANEKQAAANQAETAAREKYHTVYSQNEAYRLSVTKSESEENADEKKLYAAALWANVPEGKYWTSLVMASVRKNLSSLERARDLNDWCPGYWEASDHHRDVCWLRLLGGLVKFESSFKPDDKFKEPSGNWSVGLMALSPKECKNYETIGLLQQPLLNLSCGIGKFADLIERDGYIAGTGKNMGAAAYWSTLRAPYKQLKPDGSGYYNLGKKNDILPFSTTYRNY